MKAGTDEAAATRSPGQTLRAAREKTGLSREKLAYQAGVSTSTVARLELTDQVPNARALVRIADRVGLPVTDLLPAADASAGSP